MTTAAKGRVIIAVISSLSGFLLGGIAVHLQVASRLSAVEAEVRVLQGEVQEVLRVMLHAGAREGRTL